MKKVILVIVAALGLSLIANAQPKSIGLRLGTSNLGISYQHYFAAPKFLEVNLDNSFTSGFYMFKGSAFYNWILAEPKWTSKGDWRIYLGPGVAAGFYTFGKGPKLIAAVGGQLGLEYSFTFPLTLSLDIRPMVPLMGGYLNIAATVYESLVPCLSVRYNF